LSKLQKWILNETFNDGIFNRWKMRVKFNKDSYKEKFSNAERVIIHRTLRNMVEKGLLYHRGNWWFFHLTEKGFNAFLKTNKSLQLSTSVNFKDYQKRAEQKDEEDQKRLSAIESTLSGVSLKNESPERVGKREQLRLKRQEFFSKFTTDAVFNLCCESCKEKILEFQIQCGAEEIKKLEEELETESL